MKVRIKFAKQGAMKFIGHLDIMRYFQKAVKRAGLDAAYSEGFSPHMIMSFAAPLGVGVTSEGEYFDLELKTPMPSKEAVERLNQVMVEGMEVLSVREVPEGKKGFEAFLARYDFYWKLFLGFLPAAVLGLLLSDFIDAMLENVAVVAVMLVLGGVLMLFVDKWFAKNEKRSAAKTERRSIKIGKYQCISMFPGVSRSMATIVGGMQQGLSRKDAAEFSFFLAVPTMFGASVYKMWSLMSEPDSMQQLSDNWVVLVVGMVVAFIVAMAAIKLFISYVTKYGFKAFGWYRILVGGAIIVMLLSGISLEMA